MTVPTDREALIIETIRRELLDRLVTALLPRDGAILVDEVFALVLAAYSPGHDARALLKPEPGFVASELEKQAARLTQEKLRAAIKGVRGTGPAQLTTPKLSTDGLQRALADARALQVPKRVAEHERPHRVRQPQPQRPPRRPDGNDGG